MLVQDPDLPYPYQFPEPAGAVPKKGGVLRVGVTFDVVTFDPTLSAAGGTITVPNMTYNKMLGMVDGVQKDPFKRSSSSPSSPPRGNAPRTARPGPSRCRRA